MSLAVSSDDVKSNTKGTEVNSVDDVPFSILADLYRDLRNAKISGKGDNRRSNARAQAEARRALLTGAWLKVAERSGFAGDAEAKSKYIGNDSPVPAQVFPPNEGFKLICLLVPSLDSAHAYLGMKESKLADAFINALALMPNGDDAQWLKHHKEKEYRPQRWKQDAGVIDGNFATVLQAVLADRCPDQSSLTIGAVCNALNSLSRASRGRMSRIAKAAAFNPSSNAKSGSASDSWLEGPLSRPEDGKALAIRKLLQLGTPRELAEVARIILKDLDIRLTEDSFFNWFHPNAKQHYTQIHDIHRLLKDCSDPKFEIGEASVQVGQFASVMLTMRPSRKKLDVICANLRGNADNASNQDTAHFSNSTATNTAGTSKQSCSYFIMEPKLDGERLQLHKWKTGLTDSLSGEFQVRTFSRRGNDSSAMYAGALREIVLLAVQARDIILDGEIMIWDDLKANWLRFEDIREVGTQIAKKAVPEGASYTLRYMVFDVLYVDQGVQKGESRRSGNMVIRLPLFQRRHLLEKLISPTELPYGTGCRARIELVDMERGHDEKELIQALQRYETLGYEGVIAKHPDRPYVLAERSLDVSIKLKPDYFDGGIADLDVLILGGKYSASRGHRVQRSGKLSSFMIGVRADNGEIMDEGDDRKREGWKEKMKRLKWIPIGSVGTGYSDAELAELQREMEGEWKDFNRREMPEHFEKRDYAAGLMNEVAKWIEPWKSVVLTVRAFELNRRFGALRFPRVERIRWEKDFYEVATYGDVVDLDENKVAAVVRADENDVDELLAEGEETAGKKRGRGSWDEEELRSLKRVVEEGHLVSGGRSGKQVIGSGRGADVSRLERVCSVFEDLTVCVEGTVGKEDVELKIWQMGGKFVQNFGGGVGLIVVCEGGGALGRVRELRRKFEREGNGGGVSIVRSEWIERCFEKMERVEIRVGEVVYANAEMEKEVYRKVDRFGDGWEETIEGGGLERSLKEVEKWRKEAGEEGTGSKVDSDIDRRVKGAMKVTGNVFDGAVVWDAERNLDLGGSLGLIIAFGGVVVKKRTEAVTHVLVHSSEIENWKVDKATEIDGIHVISELWVRGKCELRRFDPV
eukprot:GFKZ01011777.1.p1 GENE.GFKZ01011777.1~~GFKZ01011777.1.p1  ORF type:complete len:1091 (+),score=213.78 GFKZ01011777.1:1213-4485(+)